MQPSKPRYTVQPLDPQILLIKLSPRISVIRNVATGKDVTYFGCDTLEQAQRLAAWMADRGYSKYSPAKDRGANKPRKSQRMPQAYELKCHRCPEAWIVQAMARDLARDHAEKALAQAAA